MNLYYFNASGRLHTKKVLLIHTNARVEFLEGEDYGHFEEFRRAAIEWYKQKYSWTLIHTNR